MAMCGLGLILPQKDRERAVYGLKEKALAKTYIKLIPLGVRDPDALALMHWKKPVDRLADGSRGVSVTIPTKNGALITTIIGLNVDGRFSYSFI